METIKRLFGKDQTTPRGVKGNEPCWCGNGNKHKDFHREKVWDRTSIAWGKTYGRNG